MKISHNEDPIPRRRDNYPAIGDQIDAIYKGFKALGEQGFELPSETKEWIQKLDKIKSKFPVAKP